MYLRTILENGVRIVSEKLDNVRSVSLGIWVNAGSRDEMWEENGISHFVEHMIFKGTEKRSTLEIAKELDAIGGMSNAFTGKENTCFHAKVLDKDLAQTSDILCDIFLRSRFDARDMELERQVILQEIGMVEDNPEDNIHVLMNRLFWPNHPIGMSILGSEESVSRINRESTLNYMARSYVPGRILIAAAGNVDHEKLVSYFRPVFEPLEFSASPVQRTEPSPSKGEISVHPRELEQVHICLGGEAPSLTSDKRFASAILNTILGGNMSSRLFQAIRENRGLAYAVYSFLSSYMDTGMLGVYAASDPDKVNEVLEAVHGEVTRFCRGELTEYELSDAKRNLTGGIYLASENSDNRMMRLARNEFLFQSYISHEELVSRLNKVTREEVFEVAEDVFKKGSLSLTVLGPFSEERIDKANLKFN